MVHTSSNISLHALRNIAGGKVLRWISSLELSMLSDLWIVDDPLKEQPFRVVWFGSTLFFELIEQYPVVIEISPPSLTNNLARLLSLSWDVEVIDGKWIMLSSREEGLLWKTSGTQRGEHVVAKLAHTKDWTRPRDGGELEWRRVVVAVQFGDQRRVFGEFLERTAEADRKRTTRRVGSRLEERASSRGGGGVRCQVGVRRRGAHRRPALAD
mmetsp:Transcript_13581/g.40969  ORF Transcript_13581/g.40969 Transcript_13581/m.40969 type:complete len:212 (+) Transcript_13581:1118-1753(+)